MVNIKNIILNSLKKSERTSMTVSNVENEKQKSSNEETIKKNDAAKSLLNLSCTKKGLYRSVEVFEDEGKL